MHKSNTAARHLIAEPPKKPLFVKFPLKHRSKEPAVRFKRKDCFDIEGIKNVGLRLDGLLVLDIDKFRLPDGITVDGAVNLLRDLGVPVDDCPRVRTGSGGEHIFLRLPDGSSKFKARLFPFIDIKRGKGSYVVGPGSIHPNGEKYQSINSVKLSQAPTVPQKLMPMLVRPTARTDETSPGLLEPEKLAVVLEGLDVTEFQDHDRWLELMMACRHACPDGEQEFVDWSTGDDLYADHGPKIAERWHIAQTSTNC